MTFNANAGYTGKIGTFKLFYDYFKQDLGMTVPNVIPLITERGRKNEFWFQDLEHQLLSSQNSLFLGKFKWDINAAYQLLVENFNNIGHPFVGMNLKTFTYESNCISFHIIGIILSVHVCIKKLKFEQPSLSIFTRCI
jgi:iron complex outermembrane receptor protein